jgi:RNA-directed DNA polymerase
VATAMSELESPAPTANLMETICDPNNTEAALRAVLRNKGAPDVDGITVRGLPDLLKARRLDRTSTAAGVLPAATGASGANSEAAGGTRDLGIRRVAHNASLMR